MTTSDDFLRDFVRLSEKTEIPVFFMLWCGISGVAATLGRKVWLDMGHYAVYPNLYVVLVAGSGRCRKSTAISQILNLMQEVVPKPNILAAKTTPEGLIDALSGRDCEDESRLLRQTSTGWVCADELGTFLNKKTYESGLPPLLIKFFDCVSEFEYRTKGRGAEVIHNVCLNLLAGSTIDWIRSAIPFDAIGSGLTSRIIFPYVADPMPAQPRAKTSPERQKRVNALIHKLQAIASYEGEFTMTPEAEAFYDDYYVNTLSKSPLFELRTMAGYASRRDDHMLKLSMVFSASENGQLVIEKHHIESADRVLTLCEKHMPYVLSLVASNEKGAMCEQVRERIRSSGGITRADLLRSFSHRIDHRDLVDITETLVHSGQVQLISQDGGMVYMPKEIG